MTETASNAGGGGGGSSGGSLVGTRVVLHGLQARLELNGERGTAIHYDDVKARYAVVLDRIGGRAGNVMIKGSNLVAAEDEPAWRADDSYYHEDLARVTPCVDPSFAGAIQAEGPEVRLTGGSASVRTTKAFLATQGAAESCVRFNVFGASAIELRVGVGVGSALGFEIGQLHDGSMVSVGLSVGEKGEYGLRDFWVHVLVDGVPIGEPRRNSCAQYTTAFPETTAVRGGVEVVTRYMSGAAAKDAGLLTWQGMHVSVALERKGGPAAGSAGNVPRLVMAETDASADGAVLASVHTAAWGRKFHSAAGSGKVDEMREALGHGADVDTTLGDRMAAVHWACQADQRAALAYLVSETSCKLNAKDKQGYAPLHIAVEKGHVECVRILVTGGRFAGGEAANLTLTLSDGYTPLMLALAMSKKSASHREIADLLRQATSASIEEVRQMMQRRPTGALFDAVAPDGHGWDRGGGACRFARGARDALSSYPPRWLYALQRLSEGNYAMLGMAEHGDGPAYVHMSPADGGPWWRLRWLPRDEWSGRASDAAVIDTVHAQLQRPQDGANRLRLADVRPACGPNVSALFLHCASALSPADILGLVAACPNLQVLSLSECRVDDALLGGLAASACAPRLVGLRLWMCQSTGSPAALGALLQASAPKLAWLDIETFFHDRTRGATIDHAAWLLPLRSCAELRVALLPNRLPRDALGELARPGGKLELLSIDGEGPKTPLSHIEPFAHAGYTALDLHGIVLDAHAGEATCRLANRLVAGEPTAGATLPRAQLLQCTRLADLRVRCPVLSEEDVHECLAKLPALKALHVSCGEEVEPALIGELGCLEQLRVLDLAGCLGNYYMHGEEVATENCDALVEMARGLSNLVQLDLSGHHDAFYACVEGEYDAEEMLTQMACCLHSLRVLNLSENGRKFAWAKLRREMRCLNEDLDEGEAGVTVHYGDGVSVYAAGGDGGGAREGSGSADDDDDDDDDDEEMSDDEW